MSEKVYGYTKSGKPIDNEMIERFVGEAEQGYEDGQLTDRPRGRGRPPLGDAAKVVGSLRLEPALREEEEARANAEGVSVSELVRRALREYLHVSSFLLECEKPLLRFRPARCNCPRRVRCGDARDLEA
jgi:hypothetical protein